MKLIVLSTRVSLLLLVLYIQNCIAQRCAAGQKRTIWHQPCEFRDGSQISFIRECDGQKITPTERVCDESKCCENHYCCEGDATSVTSSPQRAPTPKPTKKPTPKPTPAPVRPTPNPTKKPTPGPTPAPTPKPTRFPTKLPTNSPSTTEPTVSPTTLSPTPAPTASPTESPTTQSPTLVPTQSPTKLPTSRSPTNSPTKSPQFEKLDDVTPSGDQSCSLNRCRTNTTSRVTLVNRNWAIDAAKRRCATPASSDCIPCPEGAHATRRSSWQPCLPCGESPFGKFQLVRDGSVYCTGSVVKSRSEDLCTYRRSILLGTEQSPLNLPSQTFGFPSRKVAEILIRDAQASCGFLQTFDSNFITSVGRFSISIFSTFVRNSGELPIILHEWTAPPWIRPTGELIGFPNLVLKGGEQRELVFLVVGSSTPLPVTGDEEVEISDVIEFDVMQLFPNPGVDAATPFRTSIPVRISVYFEGIALMPSALEYSATSTGTPIEFTLTLLSPSTRNSYNTFFSVTRSTFNGIPTDNSDWLSVAANDGNELDSSTCGDSSAAVDNAFSIEPADFAPGYYEAIIEVTASRRTDGDEIVPLTVETAFTVVSLHITNGGPMIPSQTAFVIGEESDSFTDTNAFVRKLNDEDVEIPINQIAIQILPRDVNGYNTSVPTKGTGDGESIEFVVEWQLLSNLTEVFGSTRVTVNGGVWKTYLDVPQIGMYSIKVLTQDSTNNLVQIAGSPRHIQVTPQECTGEHEVPAPGNGKGCTCAAGYGVLASSQSDSSQRCKRCPSGTYSSEGLVVCLPCPEGTIQPNSGASSCTACGPGTEEFRGTTCVPCSVNRVSDAGTGFKCEPCGVRQVAIGNQCYCDPNYYLDPTVVDDSSCVKCPVGAYCAFATVDTLIALDGYWQVEWDKTKFLKCTPASACRGVKGPVENLIADMTLIVQNTAPTGRPINKRMLSDTSRSHDTSTSQSLIHQHNSMPHSRKLESITANSVVAPESTLFATVNLTQGCEVGFEGKFCGECSHGFFPALNSECKKCSSATDTLVTMVLSVTAFLLFFVALVYHSLSSKNAGHTDVAVTLLKQFASHLQVLGMAQSLRTTWPDWMKQAFEFFTSMSDAGSLDLHCVSFHVSGSEPGEGGMTFLDRYYNAAVGFMLAPPVVALLAYVFWTIKHSQIVTSCINKLKRTTSARDSNRNVLDTDATKVQDVNNSLLRNPVVVCVVVTLTVLLFLWQPFLTRIGLSFFACEEKLEDRYFLRTALSVECGSEKHGSVIWVGFAISFIYALGIPLLVLLVLFGAVVQRWPWPLIWNVDHEKDRKQLASNHVLAYKFLHRSFKPRYFYWESLVVIRKTAFAVTAVVLSSLEQQVLLGSVVTMIGIGLQIRFSPYKDTRDAQQYGGEGVTKRRGMLFHRWMRATLDLNRIEVVSLSLILGTFWSALFIAEFEQETTVTVILSVIIIILNIAFFVQILLCLVYEAFNIRKAIRLAKTKPEETIENGNRSNLVKDKKVVQHERLPPPSINEGGVTRLSRVASDTSVVADSVTWHVHDSDDDVGQDPVSQHVSIA